MPNLEKWPMKGGIKSKNFRGKGESKKSKKLSTWFVHAPQYRIRDDLSDCIHQELLL